MMRAVPRENTSAELAVRKLLRELGVTAYRLNNKKLPGSPDISNQRHGWAVFVHGCFWHGHRSCKKTRGGRSGRVPATRSAFWSEKIRANRARDARKCRELRRTGLHVITVWECELRDRRKLLGKMAKFLTEIGAN